MKIQFLITIICLITFRSQSQSITLLPNSSDFKSDKVVIGSTSSLDEGKLQVNGTKAGYSAKINTIGSMSETSVVGLDINSNNFISNSTTLQLTNANATGNSYGLLSYNYSGSANSYGLRSLNYGSSPNSVGVSSITINSNTSGKSVGFSSIINNDVSSPYPSTGMVSQIQGLGEYDKVGFSNYIDGNGGDRVGINTNLAGSDIYNASENHGSLINNTVLNSLFNYGEYITVGGGQNNIGIYVNAFGNNAFAAKFRGLVQNENYTMLGLYAPKIQQVEISGTTPAENASTNYSHFLTDSKILSVSILVEVSGQFIPPNYTGNAALEYNYYIASGNLYLLNKSGNSSGLAAKPFKALITYKE